MREGNKGGKNEGKSEDIVPEEQEHMCEKNMKREACSK